MGILRATASIAVILTLAGGPAAALETDPFYAWESELEDATPWINAKVNLEIEAVLARADASSRASSRSCDDVVDLILRHFRLFIFHDLELWVSNTSLFDRVPSEPDVIRGFRERFAQEALGHSSKAVHRAYSQNAVVTVPSMEDYYKKRSDTKTGFEELSHALHILGGYPTVDMYRRRLSLQEKTKSRLM